jgi:hypothetical protein
MTERAYDGRVARFAAAWGEKGGVPGSAAPVLASQTAPQSRENHPVNINFPTADSIPAVSIMSNEPGRPGQNGVGAAPPPQRSEPRPQPQASAPPQASTPPASQPQASQSQGSSAPARRPAQKAQPPRPAPQPQSAPPPEPAAADPFPQPVGSAQQTTGTQQQ